HSALNRPLAEEFPLLPEPADYQRLAAQLARHPLMQAEDAMVRAGESEVGVAREQYKPAWSVGMDYGLRGAGRSDFLSAGVTVELPIFTDKRQDRRLAASQQQAQAARYVRDDRLRELLHRLDSAYAQWAGLGERMAIYEQEIIPQAEQNAELALKSYQNDSADFALVMRARLAVLETQLEALRLRVEHAKAQADLLYLSGDEHE
ncbi:MAG: TolC family protein, partial [Gammaproteobacteria bacterium]|nr:TolC family protein [Gammaproteobacteria bacterium]